MIPNSITISLVMAPAKPVVELHRANAKAGETELIIKCSEIGFAYFLLGIVFDGEDEEILIQALDSRFAGASSTSAISE